MLTLCFFLIINLILKKKLHIHIPNCTSMSFQNLVDCHKFKKMSCLIMPTSTKCQKIEKKMTIHVIQHDDTLVSKMDCSLGFRDIRY
jgi:hypothetical protein